MSDIFGFITETYQTDTEIIRVWEVYYPGEPDEQEFFQRKHSMR